MPNFSEINAHKRFAIIRKSQSIDEALTASESRGGNKGQNSSKEDVTEFLTEILAKGPVDVLEVEAQARAATLLADDKLALLQRAEQRRSGRAGLARPRQLGLVELELGTSALQRELLLLHGASLEHPPSQGGEMIPARQLLLKPLARHAIAH
jgi:hypothetical protein